VALREGLTVGIVSGILDGAMVVSYTALSFWISPWMGGVILGLPGLQVGVFLVYSGRQRVTAAEVVVTQSRAHAAAAEIVDAIEILKAQALEQRALQSWVRHFVVSENAHIHRSQVGLWVEALSTTVRVGSPLLVMMLGTVQVMAGTLHLGTMLALNALAMGLFLPLGNLVQTALQLNTLRSHAERLEDIFRAEPEPASKGTATGTLSGHLKLHSVYFRYNEATPYAVTDLNFECRAGEFLALVGRSGSGKSTVAKLIATLYRPALGHVYDGHGLDEWGFEALRKQIGYVPQNPRFLGTQSVRLNIAGLDSAVSMDRIEAAARAAGIEEEIRALPMGFDTMMLNDGGTFSGGQRQRIALARALLNNPRMLILDEATSALDAIAERKVYESIVSLNCTRLVVAHRLSTIANADRIIVMDGSQMVDIGTHDELLSRCPLYVWLVQAQAGH
jgi:ATP-binding cassette subfamily B protein